MKQKGTHLVAETLPDLIKMLLYIPHKSRIPYKSHELQFAFKNDANVSDLMTPELKKQVKKLLGEHQHQGHLAFVAKRGRRR